MLACRSRFACTFAINGRSIVSSRRSIGSGAVEALRAFPSSASIPQQQQNREGEESPAEQRIRERREKEESVDISSSEFNSLGLLPDLVRGLALKGFTSPTPVQNSLIPRLLTGENMVMAASTGSGKTLAFCLPVVQNLLLQEEQGYKRQVKRPRCLVLVPTRELARQVLGAVKDISHFSKISSCAVVGGEQYALQKKGLDRLVDIVVASPGRLMQHKEQGNVYLSQVNTVIIDEVDTMLTQGFGSDIRAILRSVMGKKNSTSIISSSSSGSGGRNGSEIEMVEATSAKVVLPPRPVQLVMATATLTKAVRALLLDVEGGFNLEFSDPSNPTPKKIDGSESRVNLKVVEVEGLHRALSNVRHVVEESKGVDKLLVLSTVLQRHSIKKMRTLIFCNSVDATRAVQYSLNEAGVDAISYHGDLNSRERAANLETFRSGGQQYLVCTDIAARGLDVPEIEHVIMFDFPLNPVDYLHRAGRCGRAGRKGLVTSIISKRDKVLSDAVQGAIARGMPLDQLTSAKRDYDTGRKLSSVLGRKPVKAATSKKRPLVSRFAPSAKAKKTEEEKEGAVGGAAKKYVPVPKGRRLTRGLGGKR